MDQFLPNRIIYQIHQWIEIYCSFIRTGSSGATVRLYLEKHSNDASTYQAKVDEYFAKDVEFILNLLKFKQYLGKEEPDVRT